MPTKIAWRKGAHGHLRTRTYNEEVPDHVYVLVVDDDEGDAALIETTLDESARRTFKTESALTYGAALRSVPEGGYDVVLLDHMLGARTGVDLLHELRGKDGLPPIIVLTGADPETADKEALSAGASDLVTKSEAIGVPGLLERAIIYALERREQSRELIYAATHDRLTGVYNRAHLQEVLEGHIAETRRNPAHSFSLLYVDFDRFKPVNDGLGHLAGDEILVEAARRLRVALEDRGSVARHGGDEFVAVLAASDRETLDVAEALQRAFRHPFSLSGGARRVVTASIGVLHGRPGYQDSSEMVRDANIAMYRAKQQGRDRTVVFDDKMREEALRRFNLEHDLPRALEDGHITLLYQPILSLETGRAVGVETLIRWMHPEYGAVPPLEFVGIAEETGLIVRLGEHVLAQVAKDIRSWPPGELAVNVNVSPLELSESGFVERFQDATQGLPGGSVNIEITETAIVQNEERAAKVLATLRKMGVHAHLDDFGSGFASVSHLVSLPFEAVKVDISLVRKIQDPRYQSTVKAIVDLAHGLGMYCVVEGIETGKQRDIAKEIDADFAQGYLFARPMTSEHLVRWLEDASRE